MDDLVIRSDQDVARFVSQHPASRSAWLVVLVALGGIFVDAYHFSSLGVGIPQLRAQLHLSPLDVGTVTAMMSVGGLVGALWGGYLTDTLGRYKMFLLDLVLLIVAAAGAAVSVNFWMLAFFRFLLGAGVGLDFPVALSFIAEYTNTKKGGAVNAWQPTWYIAASTMGLVLLPFYYWTHLADYLWRIAVGFGIIPTVIVLVLRFKFMDESPVWAAQNLGLEKAGEILAKTYGIKVKAAPETKVGLVKPKIEMRELFTSRYRKRLIMISLLSFSGAVQFYVVAFNLPEISMRLFGHEFIYAILGAILFNIFGLCGGFFSVYNTTRLGTRKLAIIGFGIVLTSVLTFWYGKARLPLLVQALLIGFIIVGHSIGGSQGNAMSAFSFPARVRGMAVGWSHAVIRAGSIFGFYFFPLAIARVGLQTLMLWLAVFPLMGFLAAICIRWDPKGLDVEGEDQAHRAQAAALSAAAVGASES